MRTVLIILWSLLIFSVTILANNNARFAGSYTRMGLGARSIALGNTGVADGPNGYSMYYNPAVLGMIEERALSLSYRFLSLDRHIQFVGIAIKVPPGAGFSIGWLESGTDELYSYNSIGEETGEINQAAHAIYFSFGRQFSKKFSVGISIKLLLEYINDGTDDFDYSSQGVGADFGVFYQVMENLGMAMTLRDVGSKLKANTDKLFERGGTTIDRFPRRFLFGLNYRTPYPWLRVLYDFEFSNKEHVGNHIGLEASHGRNLALRLGLNESSFVAGTGLDFRLYRFTSHLDYAFVPSIVDEGSSHVFSWQVFF
jgi:hypothetical protein